MIALALGAFGSLIGSFLNVVVYRVPAGLSVVSPPSSCPKCGHAVRGYDNIPLVSWLLLRGKCRDCAAPISARYPIVEFGSAVFFAIVALRFVPLVDVTTSAAVTAAGVVQVVAFLYLAAVSLALALIDLDTGRLPNVLVLPTYVVGAVAFGAIAILTGNPAPLLTAAIGMLALGGLYLALALVRRGGMGFGDVKLAGALGLWLGWLGFAPLAVGGILGFVLGGIFGVTLLLAGRGRRTKIPFGPWMLAGGWLGILIGAPIAQMYLSLFGLR
ncbi:MAG: prepilin peptidase [Pseudolysinimonas sp.]|uniref:prepilin peptidase n=1 Tax=Pseudolysinimonas sp. TaxID=2680009 RepID=UPI0032673996